MTAIATGTLDSERRTTELWFVRRGIPHFIDGYSARRDVFTRTLPVLLLVAAVEIASAAENDWPWWVKPLVAVTGFAIALAVWALVNRLRGRPAFARPGQVTGVELGLFVLLPGLLPLVFGAQEGNAAATVAGNAVLLAAIYVGTSYGVVPMTRWAAGRLGRQLGDVAGLFVRALPMLLLFSVFLFINAEVWQVASSITWPFLGITAGLFVVIRAAFVAARLPREVGELGRFDSWDDVAMIAASSPAAAAARRLAGRGGGPTPPQLSRRQWGNVGLVLMFSQAVQVIAVAAALGAFFVVFGMLTIAPETVQAWTGEPAHSMTPVWTFWGRRVVLTHELTRVAFFLASFTAFYFTVYALTDTTYRAEFYDEVVGDMREAFAVRAAYDAELVPHP
jgi:hypothetical protein